MFKNNKSNNNNIRDVLSGNKGLLVITSYRTAKDLNSLKTYSNYSNCYNNDCNKICFTNNPCYNKPTGCQDVTDNAFNDEVILKADEYLLINIECLCDTWGTYNDSLCLTVCLFGFQWKINYFHLSFDFFNIDY